MNLKTYISKKRESIKTVITTFLRHKKTDAKGLYYYTDAINRLESFVPHGKLLRGVLSLFAYEMLHGKKRVNMIDISAAMEFNQSSLLIHDDIMDQDTLRRGNKTMYAQYMDQSNTILNPLLYGQSMAICVGDIGFFLAFELLARSGVKNEVLSSIAQEIQLVGGAQMSDVHLAQSTEEPTYDEIMNVYRYKTGRYTFALPLRVGALVAEADTSIIKQLEEFGETLGIIFQLRDDEIKLFGDHESMGASVASDIRENKKTIIRYLLYKHATPEEQKRLHTLFGNASITSNEVEEIKVLISNHGILTMIHQDIQAMTNRLNTIVEVLPIDISYKTMLQEFVAYNLTRTR